MQTSKSPGALLAEALNTGSEQTLADFEAATREHFASLGLDVEVTLQRTPRKRKQTKEREDSAGEQMIQDMLDNY